MVKIYRLVKDDKVVYVGKTRLTLTRRKSLGFYKMDREFSKSCEIELIEESNDVSRERYWIDYYIKLGFDLFNRRGGDMSEKQRKQRKLIPKELHKKNGRKKIRYEEYWKNYKKEYYEKNKDEINKRRREEYSKNPEKRYIKKSKKSLDN
jgi:hypothetical protein